MLPKLVKGMPLWGGASNDVAYHDLPTSSSEENEPFIAAGTQQQASEKSGWNAPSSKRSKLCSAFIMLSAILTLGALSLVLIVAQRREAGSLVPLWPTYQGGSRVVEHCGNSPEEAQALGCVWDLMSFGWIHPRCYNPEESQLWMDKYGPWKWYYDLNATAEIPDDELTGTRRVYTEQGYHVVHCLYIFKLLHLAGMSGHIVTDEAIPLAHTQHCVDMISAPKYTDFKHINTRVDMLFARCVTLD
ncbi:hypothetical protein SLS54_005002 [Diplodia seriata]